MTVNYVPRTEQPAVSSSLLKIWKTRYVARAQNIATDPTNFRKYPLEFVASNIGRKRTLAKLSDKLIRESSHGAAAKTRSLYLQHEYLQFNDTVDLSKFTLQTIPVLLRSYQEQPPVVIYPPGAAPEVSTAVQFGIADISTLANYLGSCFSQFKSQHSASKDWLVQCFLTSQIGLASASILSVLDPVEQAMLTPYFNLLEDYVAIPWWRLCDSANQYDRFSPEYKLVEHMLVRTSEISWAAYRRWTQQFVSYAGARGNLNNLKIRRSSLRDFDMFQVYLWLSVLQGDSGIISKELVVFCAYIFKGIGIPWPMTIAGIRALVEEISGRLTPEEQSVANRFMNGMINAFQAVV